MVWFQDPSNSVCSVPSDTSQRRNALLHFNSPKETKFWAGSRGDSALGSGEEAMLVNNLLFSDPFHAFSPLSVMGKCTSQTSLLPGWDERRRKANVFLPTSLCLLWRLWQWLCLLHCFSLHQAVPPSIVPGPSWQPCHGFSSYQRPGFWTL